MISSFYIFNPNILFLLKRAIPSDNPKKWHRIFRVVSHQHDMTDSELVSNQEELLHVENLLKFDTQVG